ncbi:unnamed protein product, partial [Staurois parvus]
MGPLCPFPNSKKPMKKRCMTVQLSVKVAQRRIAKKCGTKAYFTTGNLTNEQGQTDNSWGPRAIGDHGAPVSLPKLKKAYEIGTRGISWGPLLTSGPRTVPVFPNGQSVP